MAADDFQWVFNPANWSDKKVFAKFQTFGRVEDHIVRIEDRSLMNEEIGVTVEVFKRVHDLREVYVDRCFLGDASCETLLEPLLRQTRLNTLSLRSNNLAHRAVDFLTHRLAKPKFSLNLAHFGTSAPLEVLDLRGNKLSESDIADLYAAFGNCRELSGIPLAKIKSNTDMPSLALSHQELHFQEMILLCLVLKDYDFIHHIDLSHNLLDAIALRHLVATLSSMSHVRSVDLSYNPFLTGAKGNDLSGVEALRDMLQRHSPLTSLALNGVNVPPSLLRQIEQSLKVNRSVAGSGNDKYFSSFLEDLAKRTGPSPKANPLESWRPSFDIDVAFCSHNPVERCSLEYDDKSFRVLPSSLNTKR